MLLIELLTVLAGSEKLHLGPTFLCQAQINAGIGQISIIPVHVLGKSVLVGLDELGKMRRIRTGHPARSLYACTLEYGIYAIFCFQAMLNHLEL